MSRAYYNENDPFAAAWLRELIKEDLIAPGDVDERSIMDVQPKDLNGYTQCHFFAGIGVWSLALRLAGYADSDPVWTGSCPCQPFSVAGSNRGFADERHLWPIWMRLIESQRPNIVLGEQVSSRGGLGWFDAVQADLEDADYTCGAVDTCAAGVGSPHIRQRLYWVAVSASARREGFARYCGETRGASAERSGDTCGLAFPNQGECRRFANGERCERDWTQTERQESDRQFEPRCQFGVPGPTNGFWRNADWLYCRDGKWRAVEAGTFPLANVRSVRNRVGKLRGAGNALNVAQAAYFAQAVREWTHGG